MEVVLQVVGYVVEDVRGDRWVEDVLDTLEVPAVEPTRAPDRGEPGMHGLEADSCHGAVVDRKDVREAADVLDVLEVEEVDSLVGSFVVGTEVDMIHVAVDNVVVDSWEDIVVLLVVDMRVDSPVPPDSQAVGPLDIPDTPVVHQVPPGQVLCCSVEDTLAGSQVGRRVVDSLEVLNLAGAN